MMSILPPDPVFCFKNDMGHIHSVCFPNDANRNYTTRLLASSENGYVYFWDLEVNRLQHKQQLGESIQAVHSVGDNIITQEKTGLVKQWNIQDNTGYVLQKSYVCSGGFCKSILLHDNLILPQENSTLDIIDVNNMTKVKRLDPKKENLGSIMCLQDVEIGPNIYILGGYETGDVFLWDYNTSKVCGHIKLHEYLTSLTFDPFSRRGVCGNSSNSLQVFTIDEQFNIKLKCELSIMNDGCNTVKLRPDRKILVSGGWDGRLRLFSWKSLRLLVVLTEHKGTVTDIQFSPKTVKYWDSNIMAASGSDGVISLWSLYN